MAAATDLIRQAEIHKDGGNHFHGEGQYKKALGSYHKVFCFLNGLQVPPEGSPDFERSNQIPKDRVEHVRQLKQSTRLNMAACYLKLEQYQKCVDACGKALELGDNVKAYFRRAKAHIEQRNFSGATSDLERARALAPDDKNVAAELCKVRAAFTKGGTQAEKQQASKMLIGAPPDPRSQGSDATPVEIEGGPTVEELDDEIDVAASSEQASDPLTGGDAVGSAIEKPVPVERHASCLDPKPAVPAPSVATVVQPLNAGSPQDEVRKLDVALRELTYAWQQSETDIRIYIPFDQSDELRDGVDESRVQVEFADWSILLVITNDDGQTPLGLRLGDFHRRISPDLCTCTIRSSRLTLKLVKNVKEHWWNLLQHIPLNSGA